MKTFQIEEQTLSALLEYLSTRPYREASQLIHKIQQECQAQQVEESNDE